MTQVEQLHYLGLDKLNALDRLNVLLHGNFQITGSLSLFEYDVIKREINDIDIVVNSLDYLKYVFNEYEYKFTEWFDYSDILEDPKDTIQEKGKVTNRLSFEFFGVKCCAFYSKSQDYKICEYMHDRRFKVSHPKYSIHAKKGYLIDLLMKPNLTSFQIEKLKKHTFDIVSYQEKYPDESGLPF